MKAPSEFSRGVSRGKGVMELSKMTAMEAKLDNPALRNHENFSYGGGALHGLRQEQHPQ